MKYPLFFATIVGAVATPIASSPSYLQWMADTFIQNGVLPKKNYGQSTLYKGFEMAYEFTKNETYLDWYRNQIDENVVLENGSINGWDGSFSLDHYRIGNNFLYWYQRTKEDKYKIAAKTVREILNGHPRTPSGGFWHRKPVYPNQMWLDGIFMADSFYAKWTKLFDNDNTTAWDDIVLQYDLVEEHCRNKTTGLLTHGYDESKVAVWADPVTGSAPLVWDRAVGWYFMSLIEVLDVFPKEHAGYKRLLSYFTSLAAALKQAQDSSGGWWLIMSEPYPGMKGNYIETSGSAMFTWGWLRGIRAGYLSKREYLGVASKAYHTLVDDFIYHEPNGTITMMGTVDVGSLSSNGSYEYYISVKTTPNDYKGTGPFMYASYEWETWAGKQ